MLTMKDYLHRKGQGIVEYALLLAFIVGIAMMLSNSNIGSAVNRVFDDVADYLAYRTYYDYYGEFHNATDAELAAISNEKRIKADQEGLQSLVQNLIGLDKNAALEELKKLIPGVTENDVKPNTNGDSKTLTVLSYWDHYDASTPYITLGHDSEMNAIDYVTDGKATTYAQNSAGSINKRTVSRDRFFYSNDMTETGARRTVTAQLHYDGDTVKSVTVITHNGDANSKTYSEGMNIEVTGSGWRGYSVNN